MKKLEITTLSLFSDLKEKVPLYYLKDSYNKVICVEYNKEANTVKFNVRNEVLVEALKQIFTLTYFTEKYGKYNLKTISFYCIADFDGEKINSLSGICGLLDGELINVSELCNFVDCIKPAQYRIIVDENNLLETVSASSENDLFIRAEIKEIDIYNFKK